MKFPWRHEQERDKSPAESGTAAHTPGEQTSPTLRRVLEAVFRNEKPEILDLGPLCGETIVSLADRGARVHAEEFSPPDPTPPVKPGEPAPEVEPLRIDQEDERFQLILVWEHCDFVPPERLPEFGAELRRILAPGGWVLLFSLSGGRSDAVEPSPLSRYRLLGDDRFLREEIPGSERQRWAFPTRQIEQALAPLSIQALHLQRNQMREFLALKSAPPR